MGKNSGFYGILILYTPFECLDSTFFKFIKPLHMANCNYFIIFSFSFMELGKTSYKIKVKRKFTFTSHILYIFIICWVGITIFAYILCLLYFLMQDQCIYFSSLYTFRKVVLVSTIQTLESALDL